MEKCCICGQGFEPKQGNNPYPVVKEPDSRCCNECHLKYVIPARIAEFKKQEALK